MSYSENIFTQKEILAYIITSGYNVCKNIANIEISIKGVSKTLTSTPINLFQTFLQF